MWLWDGEHTPREEKMLLSSMALRLGAVHGPQEAEPRNKLCLVVLPRGSWHRGEGGI